MTPSSSSDRCALSHPEPSLPTALSAQLSSVCNPLPAPAQAQCYEYFSQSQHLQPRFQSNTLVALQGVWFGVYPASGIELVELRYDASKGMLTGTKLTGNQFVRAGRVSWESAPPPPPRATARAAATAHARRRPHPPPHRAPQFRRRRAAW